jgi:hypothetical protein
MNPDILQNVTLMSENPLGAKINCLINCEKTGTLFPGQNDPYQTEHHVYEVDALTNDTKVVFLNASRSSSGIPGIGSINIPQDIIYGQYVTQPGVTAGTPSNQIQFFPPPRRNPIEAVVTFADTSQLPKFAANDTNAYPAIYKYAPPEVEDPNNPWEEANWTANVAQWTWNRYDNNRFGLGLTYDFVSIGPGITGAVVRQRDELLPGPNGNTYWLQNTTIPPKFLKDILVEMNDDFPGICWADSSVAFVGGNSNVHITRILSMDAENGRFTVEKPATWFGDEIWWNGIQNTRPGTVAHPTNTIAFINRRFINRPSQYAFEDGKLYVKPPTGFETSSPKVFSSETNMHAFLIKQHSTSGSMVITNPEGSNNVNFTKNVNVVGFCMVGARPAIVNNNASVAENSKGPVNVKLSCNLISDTLNEACILLDGYGKVEASNNLGLRGDDRAFTISRRMDNMGHPTWPFNQPALFYNNISINHRRGAALYLSNSKGVRAIANKVYTIGRVAHGDALAIYENSSDVEVRDCYFHTPSLIGLALNFLDATPGSVPCKFINNMVARSGFSNAFRNTDSPTGLICKNNTFGINNTEGKPKVYQLNGPADWLWWDTTKYIFRNNVMMYLSDWMDVQTASPASGNSYNVFVGNSSVTMPQEFIDIANKFRGPSGEFYTYFSHNYLNNDGLPNWHNNIAPNLYQPDRDANGAIKYPYAETSTYLINNDPLYRPRTNSELARINWPLLAGYPPALEGQTFPTPEQGEIFSLMRNAAIYPRLFVDYENGDFTIKEGITAWDGTPIPSEIGTRLPYSIPPITVNTTIEELENRLAEFWIPAPVDGIIPNPPPIPNHPITINLSTTDLTENVTWMTKNGFDGHSGDGIYPDDNILKIPNIMGNIPSYSNPENNDEIGPSTQDEIDGSSGGGVFIISEQFANRNYTLQETGIGSRNDLNVTTQVKDFMQLGKANAGQTMSLIMHGQCDPSVEHGEFKTIYGNDTPGVLDEFYKSNSYIAFNSKESPSSVAPLSTTVISFRKHPHHLYVNADAAAFDFAAIQDFRFTSSSGNTATILLNGSSTRTAAMNNFISTLVSLSATSGVTLTVNEYGEITTASKSLPSDLTIPNIVSCTSQSYSFSYNSSLGFGGFILSTTLNPSALFSGILNDNPYFHTGNPAKTTLCGGPETSGVGKPKINPNQKMALRLKVPANVGTKNLLAFRVNSSITKRLFGGSNNLDIAAGSYIRIIGSSSNDGIYKVLSVQDGIESDTPSNTKFGATNGTEYQYLELSRDITPENQDELTSITIENVSHLPILHIKYKTLENP